MAAQRLSRLASRCFSDADVDVSLKFCVNKSVPAAEIVGALHRRFPGQNAEQLSRVLWARLTEGVLMRKGIRWDHRCAFSELCLHRGRVDILRDVLEGGVPQWVQDPDLQAGGKPALLRRLSRLYVGPHTGILQKSLLRLACGDLQRPGSRDAVALMFDIAPDDPEFAVVREAGGAGSALLTEVAMERVIATSACPELCASPGRRRARL